MFISVLDLLKIGIGPSSSHTMGPMLAAREFIGCVEKHLSTQPHIPNSHIRCTLRGSLAFTGKGHNSDRAITLGLHGYSAAGLAGEDVESLLGRISDKGCVSVGGQFSILFDPVRHIIFDRGAPLPQHPNGMIFDLLSPADEVLLSATYFSIGGGFIIDEGIRTGATGEDSPPRTTSRLPFPQWPVIVIHDVSAQGDSGQSEKEMFDLCSHSPNPQREEMMSLVETEIAHAVANEDWTRFDLAIGEYGRLAGKIFAPAQGGVYRTDRIAHTIETVKQLGITGATQSSWGPTVVAIANDIEQAYWCQIRLQERLPHLGVEVVHAANHSAQAWVP